MARRPQKRLSSVLIAALLAGVAWSTHAAETPSAATASIELSADASRPAANDLIVAILYVEQAGTDAAALARQVNRNVAAAFDVARPYTDIKAQSAGTSTWPVYGKNSSSGKIDGWRMRAEVRLEGRNLAAMSELIGKLQATLALAQVNMQPAPDTRRKVLDEATVDAIRAFEQRAALVSSTLGKRYRIRQLNVAESGHRPIYTRMRAAPMMTEAAPAPLEAGETDVSVTISGSIELID